MTGMTKLIDIHYAAGSRFCQHDQRVSLIQETSRLQVSYQLKYGQISHKFNKNYIPYSGCMQNIFSNLATKASQ